jgi:uncharacterized repeat protein (TIGR01451 family)
MATRSLITASILALALLLAGPRAAEAQSPVARPLVARAVDESQLARLPGNVRPEANAANDLGAVADTLPLRHLQLLLKRPAERESALRTYLGGLHDRASANFHRWLTAPELGRRYGLAAQDLATITAWLTRQGFTVNTIYPSTLTIDFSGTAGTVRSAFHTEIHRLNVRGARHLANMSDPLIPAALAPAVVGIVSLHDFRPHPMYRMRTQYTVSSTSHLLVPADVATIYNFNPLFQAGYTGQNQTVVVIEDTDVYSTGDVSTFRQSFGLPAQTLSQVNPAPPTGPNNCNDPGTITSGNRAFEATLDAEWAGAAAPGATIELASCVDTETTFGGLIALQNLLAGSTPPAIVSISYGECEADNGAAANAAYATTYQQAVAAGVSVFVSAGDEGAASCDAGAMEATHGIGVSGFASTAYNVAVGGTDFADTYLRTTSSYWSSTNSSTFGSALSYIPEIPWNDSCASSLIASYAGFETTYGSAGYCNSGNLLTTTAGSGGPSGCATGSPSISGIVSGSCAGAPKPSWQTGVAGIPHDGVRDLPDVSLFAANGIWGHYYVVCFSDIASGGASCAGAPSTWSGGGGTSFGAPILAGLQALVNQRNGGRQGNPNPEYYALAASQAASGLACNSTSGNATSSGCVFYDVTLGDMDLVCTGSYSCYTPSGNNGVLSTSTSSFLSAYGASAGWDFATGLGSINASNLVQAWSDADVALSGSASITANGLFSFALTLSNSGPQTATSIVISTTLPAGFTLVTASSSPGCTQTGQTVSCSIASLALGANQALTIVINPGGAPSASLQFTVSASNGDLDANNNTLALELSEPAEPPSGNGPLPLWALAALGGLLWLGASRYRGKALEP